MDPEPIDHVMRKIKKKYDQDQNNWSVIGNQDKDGNREMLISQQPNTFWLKMRQINPYSYLSLGSELTNIDDEINKNTGEQSKAIQSKKEMLQLFGMMVPTEKKDVIYTAGVERFSPALSQDVKNKIEEKTPKADFEFRKKIRQKWEHDHMEKDNLYL
jgi:hypothetical protein